MNAVGVFEKALPLLRAALELVYGLDDLLSGGREGQGDSKV